MNGLDFDREQILALLKELGEDLHSRGVEAQMFVVGGTAMALAYNTDRMTGDVDGVFEPKAVVYEAARRVAERHPDVPEDWLNDGVKGLLPGPDPDQREVLSSPGITVAVPSPEYLLALKVQASRAGRDEEDIRILAAECGVTTADEVLDIAERVVGHTRVYLPRRSSTSSRCSPRSCRSNGARRPTSVHERSRSQDLPVAARC